MLFKFYYTEIYISFTFFVVILLCLITETGHIYLIALVFSVLHEFVHLLFIRLFGCRLKRINLSVLGGNIIRENDVMVSDIKEAVINLSAPVFNLIIGLVFLYIIKNENIGLINLTIGFFNILPFCNFDGGNGLRYMLKPFISEKGTNVVISTLSVFIIVFVTVMSLVLIRLNMINFSLILINIYFYLTFIIRIFKNTMTFA